MKEQTITAIDVDTTKVDTIADLKLRVAEHIIAQDGCHGTDDVRNILAETKVGGGRRPASLKLLKMIFSAT